MTSPAQKSGFRAEIEGLRAFAVLLVLLYHAGLAQLSGGFVGVDVFFVVSGFLITGLLVREFEATGTIELLRFYAKRARRLLPASFAVLIFVAMIVFVAPRWAPGLIAPQFYGRSISWDIQRSALYIVNWLFAERSVDYHGGSELASPVQHFWSLSVEEQFYVVWPIVVLGASTVLRRSTRLLAAVLAAVTIGSFVYSMRLTETAPEQAYFVTTARAWELSLGGLAALASPRLASAARTSSSLGSVAVGFGCAAIGLSAVMFDASTAFPGTAALVPTLGTVAVLLGAERSHESALVRLLSSRPLQWIGSRSYSLYLWHWPVLWLSIAILGPISVPAKVVVVALSFLPAMASFRWIEQPLRHVDFFVARPIRGVFLTAGTAVAGYAIGLGLLATTTGALQHDHSLAIPEITTEVAGIQLEAPAMMPSIGQARFDLPTGYADGCISDRSDGSSATCSYGNQDASTTVLVVGNSHAGHWTPALQQLAVDHDWHLLLNIRSSCRLPGEIAGPGRCAEWSANTFNDLPDLVDTAGVDLLLTMPNRFDEPGFDSGEVERLYAESFRRLAALEVPVAIIAPTPHGDVVGIDCPSLLRGDLSMCATPREIGLRGSEAIISAAHSADLAVIDMTSFFCNDDVCPAVIDNILVRRDRHHLTRTFSHAMANPLGEELLRQFPELAVEG